MNRKLYLTIIYTVTALVVLISCVISVKSCSSGFSSVGNVIVDQGCGTVKSDAGNKIFVTLSENTAFSAIDIDTNINAVEIVYGDSFKVEYDGSERLTPTTSVRNGVLYLSQEASGKYKNSKSTTKITVKTGTVLSSVKIRSDVGAVKISDVVMESLDCNCDVGAVELDAVTVNGATTVKTDVGAVEVKDCKLKNVEVETNVGAAEFKNTLSDGDSFEIETSVGAIDFFGKSYKNSYNSSGTTGNTVKITTDIGAVKIN